MEALQNFKDILAGMIWSDYLDILVVAFLIYKLLPLIRTPSTMRIARAVLVVVVVAWLTDYLHLYTLSFILNQFLAVGLLAVIILFQPELRRMLDQLGSVKLRNFFGVNKPVQEMESVIAQTVSACTKMSEEQVGALIVFARKQSLNEWEKNGTAIDAQVSKQLLRNIFYDKSPLHDGAVIIRDGRLAAAGCVLPLTQSSNIHSELGTRHKASMGMSEVSDAVVVVVSEQTGIISVAVGGVLKRRLNAVTLARLLHDELVPQEPEAGQQSFLEKLINHTKKEKESDGYEK